MIYLELLALAFIIVYIVDETGIVDSFKVLIKRWLNTKSNISLKPLDCSLCMTHWVCLVYVLIFGNFSIFVYLYILFLSCNTDNIYTLIQKVSWHVKICIIFFALLIELFSKKIFDRFF